MKLIQGLHYCGKGHKLFLEMDNSYVWKITDKTKYKSQADVPFTLDQVACNRKGKGENSTSVLVILHIIPPSSTKIAKQLQAEGNPLKPVISGIPPRYCKKKRFTTLLADAYIDFILFGQSKIKKSWGLQLIEILKINKKQHKYLYICKNHKNIIVKR